MLLLAKWLKSQKPLLKNGALAQLNLAVPPPSRHAKTLLKSMPASFHCAERTGLAAV